MRIRRNETTAALLFLTPFLLTLAVFFIYATVRAVYFSFTDYDLFNAPQWVGWQNYRDLFRDENFQTALRNSLVFAFVVTVVQTTGALVMPAVLNQRIRGLSFFRTAFYMPSVTSSVVITLIFFVLYQLRGAFNYLATQFQTYLPQFIAFIGVVVALQVVQVAWERSRGLPAKALDPALLVVSLLLAGLVTWAATALGYLNPRVVGDVDFVWLQTRQEVPAGAPMWLRAPVPLIAIMIQNVVTTMPSFMLMCLAALQDVLRSYYEAAPLGGATAAQQFVYI